MKYYKTSDMWKASNVTFNNETLVAYSYGWWKFVTPSSTPHTLLFNTFPYSPTTRRHQVKVKELIHREHPTLKIVEVYQSGSLDSLDTSTLDVEISHLEGEISKGRNGSRAQEVRHQQMTRLQEMRTAMLAFKITE